MVHIDHSQRHVWELGEFEAFPAAEVLSPWLEQGKYQDPLCNGVLQLSKNTQFPIEWPNAQVEIEDWSPGTATIAVNIDADDRYGDEGRITRGDHLTVGIQPSNQQVKYCSGGISVNRNDKERK